jgi:hypothetical protein
MLKKPLSIFHDLSSCGTLKNGVHLLGAEVEGGVPVLPGLASTELHPDFHVHGPSLLVVKRDTPNLLRANTEGCHLCLRERGTNLPLLSAVKFSTAKKSFFFCFGVCSFFSFVLGFSCVFLGFVFTGPGRQAAPQRCPPSGPSRPTCRTTPCPPSGHHRARS